MKDIQTILIEKRKEKGMSQAELAKALHVTKQTVSKWETGKGMPDISMLTAISEVLDVTVDELLTGKEPETRVEIVEREVVKKPSVRSLIAIIAPIVIVLIVAITLMSVYIPKTIKNDNGDHQDNPTYLEMDIYGNSYPYDGGMGSDFYRAPLDKDNKAYYIFKAEFTSRYTFEIYASAWGRVFINDLEYTNLPIVEKPYGNSYVEFRKDEYLEKGDEIKIVIIDNYEINQSVSVKMQENFKNIFLKPYSEYAVALRTDAYKTVRYIINENHSGTQNLVFDRVLKLKYVDRSGRREYEEIWRADDKEDTGSSKVLETVLRPFENKIYEGELNIVILKNISNRDLQFSNYNLANKYLYDEEIENIELDKIYEFDFTHGERFKYYKLTIPHAGLKTYALCLTRTAFAQIYDDDFDVVRINSYHYPVYEPIEKNGEIFFAQYYNLYGEQVYNWATNQYEEVPKTYYIKVEKALGAEKGKFYLTKIEE